MRRRWWGIAAVLVLPVVLGAGWLYTRSRPRSAVERFHPPPAEAGAAAWESGPPETRAIPFRVVFTSNTAGNFDLYVWEDGRVRPLVVHPADDLYPAVSPDGRWLVFQRQTGRTADLYLMDLKRGTVEALLETPADDEQNPVWFPDSRRVMFDRNEGLGRQLFSVDIVTRRVERWTQGTVTRHILPAVAPDGAHVALTSSAWVGWSIALLDLRTRDMRVLVTGGACRPDWSPDGRFLAITTQKFDGKGDIARLDVATGQIDNLTPGRPDTYDYDPRWSPDGRWIVFQTAPDKERGNWQVWVLEVASGRTWLLTDSPGQDLYPNWWPYPGA